MSHRHVLTLLGVTLIVVGLIVHGWFLAVIWLGFDFLILGVAHSQGVRNVFGKRPNGTLPTWSWLLFFPLLSFTLIVWHLVRLISREPAHNVVTEQLVIGRRLLGFERVGDFANYVDLTAEFSEPPAIRHAPSYFSFPILDGAAPRPELLRVAVATLRPGKTYIHCAQGHGRTGLFALAVLISSGVARNVEDGMRMLCAARPGIRLSRAQFRCIELYAKELG